MRKQWGTYTRTLLGFARVWSTHNESWWKMEGVKMKNAEFLLDTRMFHTITGLKPEIGWLLRCMEGQTSKTQGHRTFNDYVLACFNYMFQSATSVVRNVWIKVMNTWLSFWTKWPALTSVPTTHWTVSDFGPSDHPKLKRYGLWGHLLVPNFNIYPFFPRWPMNCEWIGSTLIAPIAMYTTH